MNPIIKAVKAITIHGAVPPTTTALAFDSRDVVVGSIFFAIRGTAADGHNYIDTAIANGATVIVCEALPATNCDKLLPATNCDKLLPATNCDKLLPATNCSEVCYIVVENSSAALAMAAAEFYGNPSHELLLIGITGTNGKTTTATLLHDLFTILGYRVGLLSTVVNKIGDLEIPATHTTPDPVALNALLRQMVDQGCQYCFMEVSSHSVVQDRITGLRFDGGVFTNLTHDHLDYHGTFAEYLRAKKQFFDNLPVSAFSLTNIDDRNGLVMTQNSGARKRTYSLRTLADYHCRLRESHLDGMLLEINSRELWAQFIGRFNAYNLTAVYGTAIELGASEDDVLRALSLLLPVAGRFECIRSGDGKLAIVDYAHTPDALQNVLETIEDLRGGGSIITVVGCGGDRDNAKRPVMARIAAELSNRVILTSDNPRTEEPATILEQMRQGLDPIQARRTLMIADRGEAIRTAAALAVTGDVILIAGKGHETYQEINGIRHHFDDREQIIDAFKVDSIIS